MFHVGQKVVCVSNSGLCKDNLIPIPIEGKIYTIEKIYSRNNNVYLCLKEITEKPQGGFFYYRFRPVVEKKSSISVFCEIALNPKSFDFRGKSQEPTKKGHQHV